MTCPRPCSFRWTRPTIILACLALIMPAVPQVLGQAPAAAKPSAPLAAEQQKRLKERDQLAMQTAELRSEGKLPEAIRAAGAAKGVPTAVLSRGVAGVAAGTFVVNLPGSPGGARDGVGVLAGFLRHAVDQVHGGDHPRVDPPRAGR